MICAHICPNPPVTPVCKESYQYTVLADGEHCLLVHDDCHACQQADTRLKHVLHSDPVGTSVAASLAEFGVVESDTMAQALLKVGATWPAAYP